MRSKTTLILAIVAALVGAAIILSETLGPGDGKRDGRHDARVFKFDRDDISLISAAGASSSVCLKRDKETREWALDKPPGAPADPYEMRCLLDAITEAREFTRVGATEAAEGGDAGFGLDKPRLVIAVEAAGKRVELAIGSNLAIPDRLYARRTGEKEVL
ncbi:MAG: DUF4340 domain-containing protein, partial [Planctomycetota bacterium]|nr:DUF4340 domain-containing protein [Planctomycetota bacterium]